MSKRDRPLDELSLQLVVNSKLIHIIDEMIVANKVKSQELDAAKKSLLEEKEEILNEVDIKRQKIEEENDLTDEQFIVL